MGWVNRRRDHGNLIFLDLRDRYGITQVVLDKETSAERHAKAEQMRPEYVVAAIGSVRLRGEGRHQSEDGDGRGRGGRRAVAGSERCEAAAVFSAEDAIANEEVRLKYRYLDLRRPEMQHNLMLRHDIALAIRQYLSSAGISGDRDAVYDALDARGRA